MPNIQPKRKRPFKIVAQPTETTCGPTCLAAVYDHWGSDYSLEQTIDDVPESEHGGTYSVMLGIHALRIGFAAIIYTYNLRVFDPTWATLSTEELREKLVKRTEHATSQRSRVNLKAYVDFLDLGGEVLFDELSTPLLEKLLKRKDPIIAGLSATHLYRNSRVKRNGKDDDILGEAEGHFVALHGFNHENQTISIADPYLKNPMSPTLHYEMDAQRLINSVMLGIMTYDANLLVIKPR